MKKAAPAKAATKPARQMLSARVPPELMTRLGHLSVDERTSVQSLVNEAVEEYLKKRGA